MKKSSLNGRARMEQLDAHPPGGAARALCGGGIEPLETRIAPAFVSSIFPLAGLDGANGTVFHGEANAASGAAVSAVGDVNGDGLGDFLIGASTSGLTYVIFGKTEGFGASVNLADLDAGDGFALVGGVAAEGARGAGDVNGDGFDDIIVSTGTTAHVVFGQAGEFAAQVMLSALDGSDGFSLTGAGAAVNGAGDVNGDGFDDVIVGNAATDGKGAAFIVFGKRAGFAATRALTALGAEGVKLAGENNSDQAGNSVSGAGDVNGDGFDDVIVGAFLANEGSISRGSAYVVFGKAALSSTIQLGAVAGGDGFKMIGGGDRNYAGSSVSSAGDVNGDGFADVLVGAPGFANDGTAGSGYGAAYVILGHAGTFTTPLDLSTLGSEGFQIRGAAQRDTAGRSVSGAGDVNGDGFDDVIVGAYRAGGAGDPGAAYVIFGNASVLPSDLGLLTGIDGFELSGVANGDQTGRVVSGAGDVNADGFADMLVGASTANATAGATYFVFGGPSGTFIDPAIAGKKVTFTDIDGDLVTVKVNKGTLSASHFKLLEKTAGSGRAQLLSLTLDDTFDGADVSVTAKRAGGGDGMVNVGFLDATGVDLGAVKIGGDLGRIVAGDNVDAAAVKSLTVGSMGLFGGRTQDTGIDGAAPSHESTIHGDLGPMKIAGDLRGVRFSVEASTAGSGKIKSLTVGGSVIGGTLESSGAITATALGPVKIGGDLAGGAGRFSGSLRSDSATSLILGGSILGDAGVESGSLAFGSAGKLTIKGDQVGGSGSSSGLISTVGNLAGVSIGGDVRGGTSAFSGGILAGGTLGPVMIKGDVTGTPEAAYTIRGSGPLTGTKSVAIASLKIGGDFELALVLAGYGVDNTPINGHAQIGAISVGGDWIASSVSAGLLPSLGALNLAGVFGNGDDVFIDGGPIGVIAKIASVTIKGTARGSFETGDHFGIVAESIGSVKIGGVKLALTSGTDTAGFPIGSTPDFVVREVGRV